MLEWSGFTRQKVVNFVVPVRALLTCECIPGTPSCDSAGLRETPYGGGPVLHPVEWPQRDVSHVIGLDVLESRKKR